MTERKSDETKGTRKKPYQKPALKKLTPDEAHAIIERYASENGQKVEELQEEIKQRLERD